MKNENILIIAECLGDRLLPVTWEMTAFARTLDAPTASNLHIAAAGCPGEAGARTIVEKTGLDVHVLEIGKTAACPDEAAAAALEAFCRKQATAYRWIVLAHTTRGVDLAASLAVSLDAPCITGVTAARRRDNEWQFSRPLYGGKVSGWMQAKGEPCILTIQPGSFSAESMAPPAGGRLHVHPPGPYGGISRSLGVERPAQEASGLEEADVVVAAGNGIGEAENIEWIHRTARLFSKSAVGGSRIVCDRGWLPHSRQVGITGATVRPNLYIACGISGAMQHVQGMSAAGFIVSINRDPGAAIFNYSDICIVEDVNRFLPAFLRVVEDNDAEHG